MGIFNTQLKTTTMTNLQIENLNKEITYKDGKIVFEPNKGYTSETMKYLYKCGYRATTSGALHYLYDNEGNKVVTAYSWIGLLYETAKVMA